MPPQNSTKIPQKSTQMESVTDNELKCNYCKKVFSRSDSLNRHISGYCKVKKANDAKMEEMMTMLIKLKESNEKISEENKQNKEEMEKLREEVTKYKKIINNNTQNNIVNQTNITFNVKAYGTEDTSKITVNDYKKILGRGMNSVPVFVEKLHFDKNVPENHNVYISNLRDEYVLMYDGKIWRLKDRDEALQQLYEDKSDILETKFEELIERLDEPTIKMFKRFLKIKDDDDEKIKVIKKELKKVLYENREMVMKTRKNGDNLLIE
jgi:predicted  nucleic acid-binding Zn-ribbon protein